MSENPYRLIRVSRTVPAYVGEWRPLFFCPDPASPQEFVVGIACSRDRHFDGWRLLDDYSKFECVYAKRLPATALIPYFARVSGFLKQAQDSGEGIPRVESLSEQLRWGDPLAAHGDTLEDTLADLYDTVVTLKPEAPVNARREFKARPTEIVRRRVNERLKVLLALRYERVVNERGYEEIKEGNQRHRLMVNLRSGNKVGAVVSAWYSSVDSIASQILQAEADLTAAQKHFNAKHAGLFVVRPFEPAGIHPSVLESIDTFMEESKWRCDTRGNVFNTDEDENRLAEAIAEFI